MTAFSLPDLSMRRSRIVLGDRMLRLFSGTGAICARDRMVTGLEYLQFPPVDCPSYRFSLSFRDQGTGILVEDLIHDAFEEWQRAFGDRPANYNPLAINLSTDGPYTLLPQDAVWHPNDMRRKGTFHKRFNGKWLSFSLATRTTVSAERDETLLEVTLCNRGSEPLELVVVPTQCAQQLGWFRPNVPTPTAAEVTVESCYAIASDQVRVSLCSDLPTSDDGWTWTIPAGEERTSCFAIAVQQATDPQLPPHDAALPARLAQARAASTQRLARAFAQMPVVHSQHPRLEEFYQRSILTILDARWEHPDFFLHPFYAVGTWLFTIAWDTSFCGSALALLDPEGLKTAILTYAEADMLVNSWLAWTGQHGRSFYVANTFSLQRLVQEFMNVTGSRALLDAPAGETTVLEALKRLARGIDERFARADGLLDFGAGTGAMLELRTDGQEHIGAIMNLHAAAYSAWLAELCAARQDPDAAAFAARAAQLRQAVQHSLWNECVGWFDNRFPDGHRETVLSYQVFELLGTGMLEPAQEAVLRARLLPGVFLADYGMYSISPLDDIHYDDEDADWGGGGQYAGMPLRIAETLYRHGHPELGWAVLSRCLRWCEGFPYFPQEPYAEKLGCPSVEQAVTIAGGGGIQTILSGIFGWRPADDGSLLVAPAWHADIGEATVQGLLWHGQTVEIRLTATGFTVVLNGDTFSERPYSEPLHLQKAIGPELSLART